MRKLKTILAAKIIFGLSLSALAEEPLNQPNLTPVPATADLSKAQEILKEICKQDAEACLNTTLGEILSEMKKDGRVKDMDTLASVICNKGA